jgi:YHS domain-containing protein
MSSEIGSLDDGRISFDDPKQVEMETAVDPVCGKRLKRADAAAAVDDHGTTYFFCSTACRDRFQATPQAFSQTGRFSK